MDRKIPEDIEYNASISSLKAFGLSLKKDMPSILAKIKSGIIPGLMILAWIVGAAILLLGPGVLAVCIVGMLLFMAGNALRQIAKHHIAKGHALALNENAPLFKKIVVRPFSAQAELHEFVMLYFLAAALAFANTIIWLAIL